jgi:hypothetical protein
VQSVQTPGDQDVVSPVDEVALFAVFLPFFVADAVVEPFKRVSPPMRPLRGTWESGGSRAMPKGSLEFTGDTVKCRSMTSKRGHWSAENGRLHLTWDGEPEWVGRFHFECGNLVVENPSEVFTASNGSQVTAPIVSDWYRNDHYLNLKPDGSVTEQKFWTRSGTFENSSTGVRMHWTDSTGPGGGEWIAQIKHRRIIVSVSGVTAKFHYKPPRGW